MPNPLEWLGSLMRQSDPKKLDMNQALSPSDATSWPELEASWAGRQLEMPKETSATRRVRPFNWYERFAAPDADAITWPWGTIALNKDLIQNQKKDLGDTLVHELTHIGQAQNPLSYLGGMYRDRNKDYLAKGLEQEAFQKEAQRPIRRGDISLDPVKPKPRKK